ncbi:hypothetical protein B7494_g2026 [Chlorociboria aeruginascens]|nr:hypothetical protein B7494_g2026 [Chlorociboria aeruginascens]
MEDQTDNNIPYNIGAWIIGPLPIRTRNVGAEIVSSHNAVPERTEYDTPDTRATDSRSIALSRLSIDENHDQGKGDILLNGIEENTPTSAVENGGDQFLRRDETQGNTPTSGMENGNGQSLKDKNNISLNRNQGNTPTSAKENGSDRSSEGDAGNQFSEGNGKFEWILRTSEPLKSEQQQFDFGPISSPATIRAITPGNDRYRGVQNSLPVYTAPFSNQESSRQIPRLLSFTDRYRQEQAYRDHQRREQMLIENRQIRFEQYVKRAQRAQREKQAFDQREIVYNSVQHDPAVERDTWTYISGSLDKIHHYNNSNPTTLHVEANPVSSPRPPPDLEVIDRCLTMALGLSDDPAYRYPNFGYRS